MLTYKDMTFCTQPLCKKHCRRYLTEDIKKKAGRAKVPICIGNYLCLDCGENNETEKMPEV